VQINGKAGPLTLKFAYQGDAPHDLVVKLNYISMPQSQKDQPSLIKQLIINQQKAHSETNPSKMVIYELGETRGK
jgi:23S rRNA maturation mini-RNase III